MTTFRSARALRRGALALTLGLGLVASACAPEPTPPTPNQAAAHNAGVWMNAQFTAGHAFPGPFGGESAVSAAEAIADLGALSVGQAQQADRLARLEADTPAAITDGTNDVPGNLARIILAVVATGGDPHDFAGLDLVARLESTIGADGRFGAQSPLYDGVYRQGLALAALSVVTPRPTSITPGAGQSLADLPAVAWLADQQCSDGSWMAYRADTSAPCVEDPATWTYKDSNAAAMATLGLTAIGATAPVDPGDRRAGGPRPRPRRHRLRQAAQLPDPRARSRRRPGSLRVPVAVGRQPGCPVDHGDVRLGDRPVRRDLAPGPRPVAPGPP